MVGSSLTAQRDLFSEDPEGSRHAEREGGEPANAPGGLISYDGDLARRGRTNTRDAEPFSVRGGKGRGLCACG
jgi:hypothetical protein